MTAVSFCNGTAKQDFDINTDSENKKKKIGTPVLSKQVSLLSSCPYAIRLDGWLG